MSNQEQTHASPAGTKDVVAREIMGEKYSSSYASPIRTYDRELTVDEEYISSLPDFAKWPVEFNTGGPGRYSTGGHT